MSDDGFQIVNKQRDSVEGFINMMLWDNPDTVPQNRRRSLSDSNLRGMPGSVRDSIGLAADARQARQAASTLKPIISSIGTGIPFVNPHNHGEQISDTSPHIFPNVIQPTYTSNSRLSPELLQTLRLNMINMYLKYMIQALLYLLTAVLVLTLMTWCVKFFGIPLIPLALIGAVYLATREMQQPHNRLHEPNAHQASSLLVADQDWAKKFHGFIEQTANYSVGFFSGITTRLANSSMLDRQISHIPDNRPGRGS